MALLAEEIVEEWLNRNGFFTIRGIELGHHEIDLLAIGFKDGEIKCRHIEVQASPRPIGYISGIPLTNKSPEFITQGLDAWVKKKFLLAKKESLRNQLFPEKWVFELVVHQVRHEEELKIIEERGVKVHRLENIISELASSKTIINRASGADLVDLVLFGKTVM